MMILYIGSDNLVQVDALYNTATAAYVNDATVVMTLKDDAGNVVAGASALSLSYVATSNGKYQGLLPDTLDLTSGARYFLEVTCTKTLTVRFDRIPCEARYAQGF